MSMRGCVRPQRSMMWREMPRRGLSGLLRRGSAADAHAALGASLDAGLLAHLGPITAAHPYRLEAQVMSRGLPHKYPKKP